MEYYTKEDVRKVYDLIKQKGVTEETFPKVQELNPDVVVSDLLYRKVDTDILKWITYILHVVYNENGHIFITDDQYDVLYEKNKELNGESLIGTEVHTLKKYPHKYPMLRGTVEKVHYTLKSEKPVVNGKVDARKSYEEWIKAIESRTGISMKGKEIRCSLKVDGVSGVIELEDGVSKRALKRGDVDNNEAEEIEILRNVKFPHMESYGECGFKVEIYMYHDTFEQFKEKYGEFNSPRSAVTSIINSDEIDHDKLNYLSIFELEISKDGKSILPPNIHRVIPDATDFDAINIVVEDLQKHSEKLSIPADGVVIRIMDEEIQELLGRDGGINKFEVGYKFKPQMYKVRLKGVNFSMGKGGSYTPVAEIETVVIAGNEVTKPSLGSIPRLKELDLRIGQWVYVTYNVIPYLYDCIDEKEQFTERPLIPTHCYSCGEELKFEKSRLFCDNYNCPNIRKGILLNFASKVGMEGISDATIDDLYNEFGINEIHKLYKMKNNLRVLAQLDGYGEKSAQAIIDSIESRRTMTFDLLVGSLSIPNVGRTTMKTIMNTISIYDFIRMAQLKSFDKLTSIKGIGESVVRSLTQWSESERYIDFLELSKEITVEEPKKSVDSHTILFTKVRDYEFQEFLESKGYGIADKYNKSVDVVIYGEESKKTEKARKDGKMLLTLEQAYELYKYKE